jgi:hypothetical protein
MREAKTEELLIIEILDERRGLFARLSTTSRSRLITA